MIEVELEAPTEGAYRHLHGPYALYLTYGDQKLAIYELAMVIMGAHFPSNCTFTGDLPGWNGDSHNLLAIITLATLAKSCRGRWIYRQA